MVKEEQTRLPPPKFGSFAKSIKNSSFSLQEIHASCGLFSSPNLPDVQKRQTLYENIRKRNNGPESAASDTASQSSNTMEMDNPVTKKYFCESCEMEFVSKGHWKNHRRQHEKCPVVDCKYYGLPDLMDKHVELLHSTGIFEKVSRLSTPGEIAAWREERKKRYPTQANIEQRRQAMEQKQRRGERLTESHARFGRKEDRQRTKLPNLTNNNHRKIVSRPKDKVKAYKHRNILPESQKHLRKIESDKKFRSAVDQQKSQGCCGIVMFRGTSKMEDYQTNAVEKNANSNALLGLLINYGSEDEDSDNSEGNTSPSEQASFKANVSEIDEVELKSNTPVKAREPERVCDGQTVDQTNKRKCEKCDIPSTSQGCKLLKMDLKQVDTLIDNEFSNRTDNSCDDAPIEAPIGKVPVSSVSNGNEIERSETICAPIAVHSQNITDPSVTETDLESIDRKSHRANNNIGRKYLRSIGLDYRKAARVRKQSTMLEKLLEADIRHERNVLLQCVRFVCENKYFGKETTK